MFQFFSNKKKIFGFSLLAYLLIFSFLSRLITISIYGDTIIYNEWATLLTNLIDFNTYSFYVFKGELVPSVYMPPLYAFLLYFLNLFPFGEISIVSKILFLQSALSTFSVYIFYQINTFFFSKKISIVNALIFSFFPLHLYSVGQTSSITLQIFLSLLFIKYIFVISKKPKNKNLIILSIVCGFLLLTRGEFLLILGLSLIYILISKKINFLNLFKILLIISIVVSPYLIRNYLSFGEIVLVKSKGYNLWKGNNPKTKVEGYFSSFEDFETLHLKLENLEKNKLYEINRDNIFLEEAYKNILEKPYKYSELFFKKIFSLYFFNLNSTYPKYYNFFHIIPIFIVSLLSFPGLVFFLKNKKVFEKKYLVLYLLSNLIIFSFFFILPRTKLVILPVQIILAMHCVIYFYEKFVLNKKNK